MRGLLMDRVLRIDRGSVKSVKPTPQGGIEAPAFLTRTGVFEYKLGDGSIRRELRHPDEVFNADSLASLRNAPVTVKHPPSMVNAANWKNFSVGHVAEGATADGSFVSAGLVVQDAAAVAAIDTGALKELSCGYTCTVSQESGEYEGEKYDHIQRDILYNHVALLPINGGRAGNKVALRLDSSDGVLYTDEQTEATRKTMKKIRIDGIEFEVDESAAQAYAKYVSTVDADKGRLDAATLEIERLKAVDVNALVNERVALIAAASKHAPTAKFDGLDARSIMAVAIAARDAEVKLDGKSDDYVRGRFEALPTVVAAPVAPVEKDQKNDAISDARVDAATGRDVVRDGLEKAYHQASLQAWQTPLYVSKTPVTV